MSSMPLELCGLVIDCNGATLLANSSLISLILAATKRKALLTQAAWQAGPCSKEDSCRESHADLEEKEFGNHCCRP